MNNKQSFEDWINELANNNGYVEIADNDEVLEELGYYVNFIYPDKEVLGFIFYDEIYN